MREREKLRNIPKFLGREAHCLIFAFIEVRRLGYILTKINLIFFVWPVNLNLCIRSPSRNGLQTVGYK